MMAPLLLMIVNKKLNEKSVLRKPVMRGKKTGSKLERGKSLLDEMFLLNSKFFEKCKMAL